MVIYWHFYIYTCILCDMYTYIFSCGAAAQLGQWPPHSWGS